MMRLRSMLAAATLLLPFALHAEEINASNIIKPNQQKGVYTTHGIGAAQEVNDDVPSLPSPSLLRLDEEAKPAKTAESKPTVKPAWLKTTPFGKASAEVTTPVPKGPQMMQSVPVQGVDTIEVTEPAAPSTAPLEADPAKENPETPTEQTAPMFSNTTTLKPLKIVLRALNKVTGRSELIVARPSEIVHFGKLDITAVTCQMSDPNSQLDYAGFFEMNEHVPDKTQPTTLFHGWMYATSPSITSLEHPIYDVTMVECITDAPSRVAAKKNEKSKSAVTSDEADTSVLD